MIQFQILIEGMRFPGSYVSPHMITDPMGIRMLIFAVVMQIIGVLVVRKLVDIEY